MDSEQQKILVIDDDMEICMLLGRFLKSKNYSVETVYTGKKGLAVIGEKHFDAIITDFRLPDHGGFDLIKDIRKKAPDSALFVITGYSDVRMAVKAIKMGVSEYVTKPIQPDELLLALEDGITRKQSQEPSIIKDGVSNSRKQNPKKIDTEVVVWGKSAKIQAIKQNVELIAPTNLSVIVTGETGTGKEVMARAIHELSPRNNKGFEAIDCGALPKEIAGSELFGHVKGAFTGAVSDKKGIFLAANGGTLLLDEIGNLNYENQIKLLRVLQEKVIKPIGGNKEIKVDVRIIAATNENLREMVTKGSFREDLYFRLNEFSIELPSLRERTSDIEQFAEHFLTKSNLRLNKNVESFSPEVLSILKAYPWYGNLRELKNVVQRSTLLTQGSHIEPKVLPEEIVSPVLRMDADEFEISEITDLKTATEHAERIAITKALQRSGQNKSKTAELLKVDRKTLYNKMKILGLDI